MMYRFVRTVARQQNSFRFSSKKKTPQYSSSGINLDDIPDDHKRSNVEENQSNVKLDEELEVIQSQRKPKNKKKNRKEKLNIEDEIAFADSNPIDLENIEKTYTKPISKIRNTGILFRSQEDKQLDSANDNDEQDTEGIFDQTQETTQDEMKQEVIQRYMDRLEKHGYDVQDLYKKQFEDDIRQQKFGQRKNHFPFIEQLEYSQGQTEQVYFHEYKEKVPYLEKSRAYPKQKEDLNKFELLNSPYIQLQQEQVERIRHGQGIHKGQISLFLNPNLQNKFKKQKTEAKTEVSSQNHHQLLHKLKDNPGKEDKYIGRFLDRFQNKISGVYFDTIKKAFTEGILNTTKLSAAKKTAALLSKVNKNLPAEKSAQFYDYLFNSLFKDLDENYSEFTVQKIKQLIPFAKFQNYFSRLFSILIKYQNKTLLKELLSGYQHLIASSQIPDKDYNKLLVQYYGQQPIKDILQLILQKREDTDYQSFRAEVFEQKAQGKQIFKATAKQIEEVYKKVKTNPRHLYSLYIILEIALLNQHHHIIFDAYMLASRNPIYINPTIQRFYHDSLLMLPISNLQDVIMNLIKEQKCNLVFSIKGLVKSGLYEQAWDVFKEKVLDEVAPGVMTERIRTFFRILYHDYGKVSGRDVTALLQQSEKFVESIKDHSNYLTDIYNRQNVYNRQFQQRRGYFKTLFTHHQILKTMQFTQQQGEMLYTMILRQLDMIPWDINIEDQFLNHMFMDAIQNTIKQFQPIKEYMDSVSEYQYKKEWELHLMQLNIYIEELRTNSSFIKSQEYYAFEEKANPAIRYVLEDYDMYPLAQSKDASADEMTLALSEIRLNNYWIKKTSILDRIAMEDTKFVHEEQERVEREENLNRNLEGNLQSKRQDRFDGMDNSSLFTQDPVELRPGQYQKIETIEQVFAQPGFFTSPIITGEQQYPLRSQVGDGQYENAQVEQIEGQQNVQQVGEEGEAVAGQVGAAQVEQAAEEGAQAAVEQGAEQQQQYEQQAPQMTQQEIFQAQQRQRQQYRKFQLNELSKEHLYYLGTVLKDSSHYKQMMQGIRKPMIRTEVQNNIQTRNAVGENAHLMEDEKSTHLNRFHDEDQSESELGLYEPKIDLDLVKPQLYRDITTDIDKTVVFTTLFNNQDLEHIENMPTKEADMEELENDIMNYQNEIEGIDEDIIQNQDSEEELQFAEQAKQIGTIPYVQQYNGQYLQQGQEGQEVQQIEEGQVAEEAVQEAAPEQVVEGEGEQALEQVQQPAEMNLQGEYYDNQDTEQSGNYVEANEYGITNFAQALRLQYFRVAKVHRIWNNSLIDKHEKLENFAEGLTRSTHIMTTERFQKLKNFFPNFWIMSENLMNVKPEPLAEELIAWGILNQQPMAIYMGQKLAMITRQTIPDHLAKNVSKILDLHEDTPEHIRQKSKLALQHVGKLQRQKIYQFNKTYRHIIQNKQFDQFLTKIDCAYEFPNKDTIFRLKSRDVRQFAPGKISDSAAWKKLQAKAFKKQCDYI